MPWRKDPALILCLFKLTLTDGYHMPLKSRFKNIYTIKYLIFYQCSSILEGDTATSRNVKFAKKLFKQPEFSSIEGSADSVRQMFDNVKKKIMSDHGWGLKNGGVTTNLSNKKGEMDALSTV